MADLSPRPGAPATSHRKITHATGLTFTVIPAASYTARMARDVRQLTMADGSVWTVGAPIGWRGVAAAWQHPVQTDDGSDDACPLCGRWACDPTTCPPSATAARDQLAPGRAHAADGGGRR